MSTKIHCDKIPALILSTITFVFDATLCYQDKLCTIILVIKNQLTTLFVVSKSNSNNVTNRSSEQAESGT